MRTIDLKKILKEVKKVKSEVCCLVTYVESIGLPIVIDSDGAFLIDSDGAYIAYE